MSSHLQHGLRIATLFQKEEQFLRTANIDGYTIPGLVLREKGKWGDREATLYLDVVQALNELQVVAVEGGDGMKRLPKKGACMDDLFRWVRGGFGKRSVYLPHKKSFATRLDQNDRVFLRNHVWSRLASWTTTF